MSRQNVKSLSRAAVAVTVLATSVALVTPAIARGVIREKSVNLDIALRVAERLRAAGVDVLMTRTTDRTVSLNARTGLANARAVDAFISIHNNASPSRAARGSWVIHQLRGGDSKVLGSEILDGLRANLGSGRPYRLMTRRGHHGDYYFQLRTTGMTAVIVESAFVSNPTEGRLLATSASYRRSIADAIADGVIGYQRTLASRPSPAPDPGTVVRAPLPAPTEGVARALGGTRVALSWTANPVGIPYRVYRNARLIGTVQPDPAVDRLSFTDIWAAPFHAYTYEVRTVRELPGGVYAEGEALQLRARTPRLSLVLDPGHGGRDPGAVSRY
jgi:N-acetylmuramoyl-L-alanine amidase